MTRLIDITGQRFGRWTVLERMPRLMNGTNAVWRCRCDCGGERAVLSGVLRRGESKSCGCYRAEVSAARETRHGQATRGTTRTYNSWANMLSRCENPRNPAYYNYGGRGISICLEWRDFARFRADMGDCPPGHSIDRKENNGNYEPGNCRWATPLEQAKNRRPRRWKKRPDSIGIRVREI